MSFKAMRATLCAANKDPIHERAFHATIISEILK